ncbi:rCG40874, isoform CRA_c [Rattus norvegicus]|uniref:Neuroendocrine secretory protein 55 n=2 Tax=Rattus norvegicus TaxID=10116 RepID=G3V916_RAT|nr:SCG6 (secretogranin VI) isoform SCG6 precursor [Rattus norvegicus]NP_001153128.1 SCG6 (secretogranin VI) isoform SCG6 precursor [Rattus norvegicus]XP_038960239.1 SCG6 (secretogranin VI) isoform X17 [Rattus norvegicus]EDL85091.1 rCG40874, isoform CRA_c [Rattus norvegicus]|eukprot:NP_001153125.1 SCG6 (secretogranin VI) isoform SCG6 precursor [Rattus norvegicus]
MDRRSRAHQWRRARHNYNDLCPPIGRRAATALLWLSCSIALLRALASSNARAQQRAAQRRSFLNAHHRSAAAAAAAQVLPESSESESDHEHEEAEPELARPECLEYDQDDYETETDSETEPESDIQSETEFETEPETEPETAPTTEPETEPEDERGPRGATFNQSLTQRLHALKLQSADASPRRAQPTTQEPESASEGEEPQREPLDEDPRDPEESEELREANRQPRRCKTRRPARRRDQSPESPPRKGPIPIRRH